MRGGNPTSDASDALDNAVDHLLANGVVTASIVVGSVFLAADQQLRVVELAVGAGADLVDRGGIQVDEDGARDVFSAARLGEEGLVRATLGEILSIRVGTAVSLEAMLQQVPRVRSVHVRRMRRRVGTRARTVPRHCYRAGHRPGQCEDDRSAQEVVLEVVRRDN